MQLSTKPLMRSGPPSVATIAALFGIIVVVGGWVFTTGGTVSEFKTWIANHEQLHKDRQVAVSTEQARTDQRLLFLEGEARKMENMAYRLTVLEQGTATLGKSVEELKTAVNSQAADIRVMLEIVRRMDPATNGTKFEQSN